MGLDYFKRVVNLSAFINYKQEAIIIIYEKYNELAKTKNKTLFELTKNSVLPFF